MSAVARGSEVFVDDELLALAVDPPAAKLIVSALETVRRFNEIVAGKAETAPPTPDQPTPFRVAPAADQRWQRHNP